MVATGEAARRRLGDPREVPWRLLRPAARHADERVRRQARARLLRPHSTKHRRRSRAVVLRQLRDRQDHPRDARSREIALEAGRSVAIYSLPKLLGPDPPHVRRRDRRAVLLRSLRAPRHRRPAPHRRPRRREAARNGSSSSSTRSSTSATRRQRSLVVTTNLEDARARGPDRRPRSSLAWSRCAATRCRCSTTTAACASRRTWPPRWARAAARPWGRSTTSVPRWLTRPPDPPIIPWSCPESS